MYNCYKQRPFSVEDKCDNIHEETKIDESSSNEDVSEQCANHEDSSEDRDEMEKSETESIVSSAKSEVKKTLKSKENEPIEPKESRFVI